MAYPVLRHRIFTNFNADAEGIDVDQVIEKILADGARADLRRGGRRSSPGRRRAEACRRRPQRRAACRLTGRDADATARGDRPGSHAAHGTGRSDARRVSASAGSPGCAATRRVSASAGSPGCAATGAAGCATRPTPVPPCPSPRPAARTRPARGYAPAGHLCGAASGHLRRAASGELRPAAGYAALRANATATVRRVKVAKKWRCGPEPPSAN